tara:strand:- start:136 stop:495 length:360 start_codon:yes stop_codon:yes gene_type:complete
MSTIKANDIQNASGGIPTVKGQDLIPTAWTSFIQTTNVIHASENVSSLTDIAVGKTYVNFAVNMSSNNYACVASGKQTVWGNSNSAAAVYAVNYVYLINVDNGSFADSPIISAAVFGGQ